MTAVLPPPNPPFPIKDTFRIRADLYPLGAEINGRLERAHFVEDELYYTYITQKLDLLKADVSKRRLIAFDDPEGLAEALWRVYRLLARDQPDVVELAPSGEEVTLKLLGIRLHAHAPERRISPLIEPAAPTALGERVAAWLEQQPGVARLADALALSCQEDIVIMQATADADRAELLHVCFPSRWDPRAKLNTGFASIHGPIPRNEALIQAGRNVMRALLTKGPFIRFGWSLTLDPRLDHHPDSALPPVPDDIFADPARLAARTFLRMERQTTYPMPDLGRALFSIRTYVQPLSEAVQDSGRRTRLAHILSTLEPEVAAYKGLARMQAPLVAWLSRG